MPSATIINQHPCISGRTRVEQPVNPIPSATVLLLRDSPSGLEVFMVTRNAGIDFAGGALVFPGGKFDSEDFVPETAEYCDGVDGLDLAEIGYRVCGIRETFEEAGFLLARAIGDASLLNGERCSIIGAEYREAVHAGEMSMKELARKEKLTLACDYMVPFAHWITPRKSLKRYDTWFFLAEAPDGQMGSHDNSESVDSLWINPDEALGGARNKAHNIVFATRMNLRKLGRSNTVDLALTVARADNIVTVEPVISRLNSKVVFSIPLEAGYGIDQEIETDEGPTKVPTI